jgi:hypothetical protein
MVTRQLGYTDMDPEKNQLSTKSSPAILLVKPTRFRREKHGKEFLRVFCQVTGAIALLLGFHCLVQHGTFTTNLDTPSLQQIEGGQHRHHRLTMKEREKMFLYVCRLVVISFIDSSTLSSSKFYSKLRKRSFCVPGVCIASSSCRLRRRFL